MTRFLFILTFLVVSAFAQTPEELLNAFGDELRANPRPFSQFTPQERGMVEAMLTPNPAFTEWQKVQIRQWKLLVSDQAAIDAANATLAADGPHRISARTATNGDLLLESDLLSDRNGNYFPIKTFLESLTLVSRPETDFPQLEDEE